MFKSLAVSLFILLLWAISRYYGPPIHYSRKELEVTILEQREEIARHLASDAESFTTKKGLENQVEILTAENDMLIKERVDNFRQNAESCGQVTILMNKLERLEPIEKKYNDLKSQLQRNDKKDDQIKALEVRNKRTGKLLDQANQKLLESTTVRVTAEEKTHVQKRQLDIADCTIRKRQTNLRHQRAANRTGSIQKRKAKKEQLSSSLTTLAGKNELSEKVTADKAVIATHTFDHSRSNLRAATVWRALERSEDKQDQSQSVLNVKEPRSKANIEDLLEPDDEEEKKELATKLHNMRLPGAVDADIEGLRSSLAVKDARIELLEAALKSNEAHIDSLKLEIKKYVRDRSEFNNQADDNERRIQKLDNELDAQKQTSKELESRLEEKAKECTKLATDSRNHKCDHLSCEDRVREKDRQLASLHNSLLARDTKLAQMEKEKSAKRILLERRRVYSTNMEHKANESEMALSEVNYKLDRLKESLRVPSECSVEQLEGLICDWKKKLEALDAMTSDQKSDHTHCEIRHSHLDSTIKTLEQALGAMTDKYNSQVADSERTVKDLNFAVGCYKGQMAQLKRDCAVKDTQYKNLQDGQAKAIDAARDEARRICWADSPQRRQLRNIIFESEGKLGKVTRDLAEAESKLEEVAQQRGHEQAMAGHFREDAETFAQSAKKFEAELLGCMKARGELGEMVSKLQEQNNELSIEVAKHTNQATPSGLKRGVEGKKDEKVAGKAYEPNKRGRAAL